MNKHKNNIATPTQIITVIRRTMCDSLREMPEAAMWLAVIDEALRNAVSESSDKYMALVRSDARNFFRYGMAWEILDMLQDPDNGPFDRRIITDHVSWWNDDKKTTVKKREPGKIKCAVAIMEYMLSQSHGAATVIRDIPDYIAGFRPSHVIKEVYKLGKVGLLRISAGMAVLA